MLIIVGLIVANVELFTKRTSWYFDPAFISMPIKSFACDAMTWMQAPVVKPETRVSDSSDERMPKRRKYMAI